MKLALEKTAAGLQLVDLDSMEPLEGVLDLQVTQAEGCPPLLVVVLEDWHLLGSVPPPVQ